MDDHIGKSADDDWNGAEATLGDLPTNLPMASSSDAWAGSEATLIDLDAPAGETAAGQSLSPIPAHRTSRHSAGRPARGSTVGVEDPWHREGRPGPLSGQIFGEYELGGILGEGGMGTVYRARQLSLGRRVAVKTLPTAWAIDGLHRERFENEARAASLIHSPHVVQVYAAGNHNDVCYFVMEYVAGTDLAAIIRERCATRGLPADQAVDFVLQAARGLDEAARHGVVHRDIKPPNLLLTNDGMVKIADFGISKILGESQLTRTGTTMGTPSYISPEQGRGGAVDGRSDLYSLGVVFYELLTGRKPFEGTTPNAIIYQHNYAEPALPRDIDPTIGEQCQAVVLKLLQKDPANRYPDAAALVADLERVRAGSLSLTALLSVTYGTGADAAVRRYLGQQRRWVTLAIAALLLLVLGGIGGLWLWQRGSEQRAARGERAQALRIDLRHSLDAVRRLPGSADSDIAALVELVGERDADIVRWRQKIARVDALHQRLSRLDQAPFAGAALRAEAEADLNALIELVGDRDQPHITRWQLRVTDTAREIVRLADIIAAEMDRAPIVSLAQRERLALPMAQMRTLAGADDPRVLAWTSRFEAADQRLAELRIELDPLVDPDVAVTEASAARLATLLSEYDSLADMATLEAKPWRVRLQTFGATMDALRRSLARIDEAEVVSEEAQAAVATDLTTYRALASPDDARLAGWLRRLAASRSLIEDLRRKLVVLDARDAFSLVEIEALWTDHERLRPLVLPTDAQAVRWGETLSSLRRDVAAQRALLERLLADEAQAPVSAADRDLCERALSVLSARQALNEQDRQRYRRRLIREQERVEDLRRHLLAREDEPVRDREFADAIRLFGRLVGESDPDFARWYGKGADYLRLRDVLAPLDEAVAIPAEAGAGVDAFAALVGEDDAEVVAWRRKLERVGQLQGLLAPLSARAPTPDDATMLLAELRQLVGDFAEHPAWDAKLARIARLHADLQRLLDQSCMPSAEAPRLVAALAVEVGDADARVVAWRDRMRELAGPGRPAWAAEHGNDASGTWARLAIPGSDLAVVLRYCPPGSFVMGSPGDEIGREGDERQVLVTLTSGIWMAETECTQALWATVMRDDKRIWFAAGPDLPADGVARAEAQAFCARVSALFPDVVARLPTEAEWEYACRASSRAPFSDGGGPIAAEQVDRVAWSRANAHTGAKPVRGRQPNRLGLHDLHGNLWEWCADGYALYDRAPVTDPAGTSAKGVARGGSWGDAAEKCRAANRLALDVGTRSGYLGFRFVLSAP